MVTGNVYNDTVIGEVRAFLEPGAGSKSYAKAELELDQAIDAKASEAYNYALARLDYCGHQTRRDALIGVLSDITYQAELEREQTKTVTYNPNCFHSTLKAIDSMCKVQREIKGDGTLDMWRIIPTGDLEFYDHGVGFLCVHVCATIAWPDRQLYSCSVHFATIDDVDLDGGARNMTLIEANTMVEQVMASVFEPMHKLPHIEDLQQQLSRFGIRLSLVG